FLMADNHDRPVVVCREASDDGTIVAERAVTMELEKVSEQIHAIIARAEALGLPGELGSLPGSQFAIEGMFDLCQFHPQFADLVLGSRFPRRGGCEFFDLFFDLADRFFKLEVIAHGASLKD